jgi:hypothetical protein
MTEEKDKQQNQSQAQKPVDVHFTIDKDENVDALRKEIEKAKEEARLAKEEALKAHQEKESMLKEKEDITREKEDYENKLHTIAEQEYEKKVVATMERAKIDFKGNEKRVKEIETKLRDPEHGPENMKATDFMLDTLEESFKQIKETQDAEKARIADEESKRIAAEKVGGQKEAPRGGDTASLGGAQASGKLEENTEEGYPNVQTMVDDLYSKVKSRDPVVAAQAEAQLRELWARYAKELKDKFHSTNEMKSTEGVSIAEQENNAGKVVGDRMSLKEIKKRTGAAGTSMKYGA